MPEAKPKLSAIEKRHNKAVKKLGFSQDEYYSKRGRKTLFRRSMIEEVRKLAGVGMIMDEIAVFWGVHKRTVERWAKRHPEFRRALKEGRLFADKRVEDSLYHRAIGFETTERHYEIEYEQDQAGAIKAVRKLKKEIVKQIAGDTTAIIFFLKNRRPDKWRDDRGLSLFGPEGEPVTVQLLPASEDPKLRKKKDEGPQGGDGPEATDPVDPQPPGATGNPGSEVPGTVTPGETDVPGETEPEKPPGEGV